MIPSFKIGDLEIDVCSDGVLNIPLDLIFNMERARSEALAGRVVDGCVPVPVNNFVFRRGGKTILIDAGAGNTMYPTVGKLPENLLAAGIDPGSVDAVILTHIHPDHANGLVDDIGEAVYPNAEILLHEREYDFWTADPAVREPDMVSKMRARNRINMKPYAGRIRPMSERDEVFGCTPILSAGHTPGHACWRINSGKQSFLAWGDTVHFSAIQIPVPEASITFDLDPDMAVASRRRILDFAADERIVVAGAHITEPGFGHVVRSGTSYAFENI